MSKLQLKSTNKRLLEVENLTVKIGKNLILDKVNLEIFESEIVTIVGPNGAGKSTLLRCIIGAVSKTSGQVSSRRGLRIGYVPQKMQIDPSLPMTVKRFLNLPHRITNEQSEFVLSKAGVPDLLNRQISELSGGESQRVLLARALANNPELLILDEANQGLDHLGSISFYRQIEDLRLKLRCAILMVSHELHVVMAASDRVICLNGHVCCAGSPRHVSETPEYHSLFGKVALGTMAIYDHNHDHHHHDQSNDHDQFRKLD